MADDPDLPDSGSLVIDLYCQKRNYPSGYGEGQKTSDDGTLCSSAYATTDSEK